MKLVAVMDLMAGQVVHARRGQRDAYQPLRSRLCAGSDPVLVARALLALHPFDALYVADLDAILGRGDNLDVIGRIRRVAPDQPLWLDAGIADGSALRRASALATPVIGSESLADLRLVEQAAREAGSFILSLDFRAGRFLGPADLMASPRVWPRSVLAMNLDRVGAGEGPDLELMVDLAKACPGAEVFAAGGIRGRADLEAVAHAGGAGALIATALHDGRLTPEDLGKCG